MKINHVQFGEKGKVLVFLHGWGQSSRCFFNLVPYLYKRGYRLFLVDLPGFGDSQAPDLHFSSFDYAESIRKWIKKQKLSKIHLIGHSFGGKIATIVAKENPKLVSSLILIGSAGIPQPHRRYRLMNLIPASVKGKIPKNLIRIFASDDYRHAQKLLPIFKTVVKEDIREIFKKIKVPSLIIWGRNDEVLPVKNAKQINKLIPRSHLFILEGNHFPFIESPKKVAILIDQFIKDATKN